MQINNFEKFIAKINSGKCASGMVITLNDPAVSELAGDAGFDFTWIDMEHSPMTIKDVADHVMALRGTNCAPLVRVTGNSTALIKPVVDLAPAGIIIPMVKTADELESAVADCRYPPEGTRGCGLRRAIHYGAKSTETYFAESEREPLIIAQIEHIDAVRNLDEILSARSEISEKVSVAVAATASRWGLSITSIEINEYDCGSDSFLRFSRYLESGETEHFTEYCKLILHQRESC